MRIVYRRCPFCDGPAEQWGCDCPSCWLRGGSTSSWCVDFCDAFSNALESDDDA